jgi:hypothetical protein
LNDNITLIKRGKKSKENNKQTKKQIEHYVMREMHDNATSCEYSRCKFDKVENSTFQHFIDDLDEIIIFLTPIKGATPVATDSLRPDSNCCATGSIIPAAVKSATTVPID